MVEARGRSASLGGGRWVYEETTGKSRKSQFANRENEMGVENERIVLVVDVVKLHLKL